MTKSESNGEIIIYESGDGTPHISVRVENETVWLDAHQMADLFGIDRSGIVKHIKNIYETGELEPKTTCAKIAQVAKDGKKRQMDTYNLDVIISVGYRVNSIRGTHFRIWATKRLNEYLRKGFTMDDERLKNLGGGNYWKELLDRIRDIRSSEKVLYRQVLDLYATSVDYDPKSKESVVFFKTVQNKLHYATNRQTAAETIYSRADAEKDFMGLTTFSGSMPIKSEITIAKNYLNEDELFRLNRMVSAFFDLAEIKAREHTKMYMQDWVVELDKFAEIYGKGVLKDAGKVSHKQATEKAEKEYRQYQVKTLSPVEKAYLNTIRGVQKKIEKKTKDENSHE